MIIEFTSELDLRENKDPDNKKFPWYVHEQLLANIDQTPVIVPACFKTDLASVPQALWWFQPPFGIEINKAAVLHDWLYTCELLPRKMMDDIFYSAMLTCGMPQWKAKVCWSGVRALGGTTYGEHTPSRIALVRSMSGIEDKTTRPLWKNFEDIKQGPV